MPATGLEEALPFKPDHSAVQMQLDLKKISQGFHGQPDYEEPTETDGITIANHYLRHSGAWTVGSRGSLLLTRRSLAEP
eukprot:6123079-Amphidinium_carterae.1